MPISIRVALLFVFTICCVGALFFLPSITQDASYHEFADSRMFFGVPNFYNVISNLPFLMLGVYGLIVFFKNERITFSSLAIFAFFVGVSSVGLGSGYYHLYPSNTTLVWDRIPMTITFMSFLSIIISRYVNKQWGDRILTPMLLLGIGSVVLWYYGEQHGHGDLRLYALVQFYPMLAVPFIIFIFPAPGIIRMEIVTVIVLYGVAKFFEHEDQIVYNALTISGHSIKHLFAAAAVLVILQMVTRNEGQQVTL